MDPIRYLGAQHLLDVVLQQYDSLQKLETSQQILKFQPVTEDDFNILSDDSTRPCKSIKFHYHRPTQLLLVKVVPGWEHGQLASLVKRRIECQLMAMDVDLECLPLCSPLNDLGTWIKEPDLCWVPEVSYRRPTCVVEIGTSESAHHLASSAHVWLESRNPVQAVITICFKHTCLETDANPLTITVWGPGHRLSNIGTQGRSCGNLCPVIQIAHLDVWNNAGSLSVTGSCLNDTQETVSTDEIRLPLELFIGRQAINPGERDVVITKEMLIHILRKLWVFRQQSRRQAIY